MFSDLLTVFGRDSQGGFNPGAAAALAGLTLAQLEIILRDPKLIDAGPADPMSPRDYHRLYAIANCWPEWLEEKDWRERFASSDP